jgi:hydrogenase-4 component F
MELLVILLIPALASGLSLLPTGERFKSSVTLVASALVLALSIRVAKQAASGGPVIELGDWLSCDALGALILVLVAFVGLTAALFSSGYIEARTREVQPANGRHYYVLYNLFLLSMLAVPLIGHIALVWIAIALTTLFSAFLVGFEDTPEALEAAWKYVVLTTLGAVIALLGVLILYWGTRVAGSETFSWAGLVAAAPHIPAALLWSGFLLVLVGFGTKAGLVPMHTWLPDAHSQAPASVCALLSGVETTIALYAILRLFPALEAAGLAQARAWFIVFGLISVGVAALLLIHVRDYKRLFAFSTVEHMGIILVAAGLGGVDAHFGAALQMTSHALTKSFCFFAAGATVLATGTQEIAEVRGLMRISPGAASMLFVGALAIAGAPPLAVFLSEFAILKAGLAAGQFVAMGVLAFLIVVAFCAIMLHVNRMVFGAPFAAVAPAPLPRSCVTTLVIAAIPVLVLGLYVPSGLLALLQAAAAVLGG